MQHIIIADNQDITRAGLLYVLSHMEDVSCQVAGDKSELIHQLKGCPRAILILDYTLFDFSGTADLLVLGQRYPLAHLILWSEDLSIGFIRSIVNAGRLVSVLMKDARLSEIEQCLDYVLHGHRFLCQHAADLLLAPAASLDRDVVKLTKTETEILKEIALGLTTREIAEKRFSSFHTVNTHRKNIFRKLGVNNVHAVGAGGGGRLLYLRLSGSASRRRNGLVPGPCFYGGKHIVSIFFTEVFPGGAALSCRCPKMRMAGIVLSLKFTPPLPVKLGKSFLF